ncbi:hypothetical protein ACFSUS_20515 [Spirosoma soli]|uniref:Uncharacterized protein n=1 Tax=Spirosoma soli TaxID=1770529 RepID=A0ABW5MBV0_9BACT
MKRLLILLLLSVSTIVTTRPSTSSRVKTRISDDGRILSIQIDGFSDRRTIHYNRSFNVVDMNRLEVDLLTFRVFSSQGVTPPFDQMSSLLLAALGLSLFIITLLIVVYRQKRSALMNPVKSLRSE